MDGFQKKKEFFCRELGYCALTPNYNDSILFDLTEVSKTFTKQEWDTATFTKHRIHGLSLRPFYAEKNLEDLEQLEMFIRIIRFRTSGNGNKNIVAYKGGHFERDVLNRMDVPSINLEDLNCPKFDELIKFYEPDDLPQDCGHHIQKFNKVFHCPKVECYVFAEWLKDYLN